MKASQLKLTVPGTDIARSKTRARRNMIVAASKVSDAERLGATNPSALGGKHGEVRDAKGLMDRSVPDYGLRILQRRARFHGRNLNPDVDVPEQTINRIGQLRTDAAKLGYQIRTTMGRTGSRPVELIRRAQEFRKRAMDEADRALGVDPSQAPIRRSPSPEMRKSIGDQVVAHNREHVDDPPPKGEYARNVVEGYDRKRSKAQQALEDLGSLLVQIASYGNVRVGSQLRAMEGRRFSSFRSKGTSFRGGGRRYAAAKARMEKAEGRKPTSRTAFHAEKTRETEAKWRAKKATKAAKAAAGKWANPSSGFQHNRPTGGLRIGSAAKSRSLRMGSLATHLRAGSAGHKRMHFEVGR